jgi:hypothetical protein
MHGTEPVRRAPRRCGSTADVSSFDADLDRSSFAAWWGGVPKKLVPGVVVNLRVDGHDEVDQLHRRAVELGASELEEPRDSGSDGVVENVDHGGPPAGGVTHLRGDRRTAG